MNYGYCRCGAEVKSRTRGIPSIDTCENGHQGEARMTLSYDPKIVPAPTELQSALKFLLGDFANDVMVVAAPSDEPHVYTGGETPAGKFTSPVPLPTAYENELLNILIEECAEVIQRATKMKRFGVKEIQPGQPDSNVTRLSHELGDLWAVVERANRQGIIDIAAAERHMPIKHAKLDTYLQHSPEAAA